MTYERIVDAMIELARATATHRIIVAGPQSTQVLGDLHRRGYARATRREIAIALANLEDRCPDCVIADAGGRKEKIGAVAS
jgi:hypothetical protein